MSEIAQTQLQLLFCISLTDIPSVHLVLFANLELFLNYYKSFAYIYLKHRYLGCVQNLKPAFGKIRSQVLLPFWCRQLMIRNQIKTTPNRPIYDSKGDLVPLN